MNGSGRSAQPTACRALGIRGPGGRAARRAAHERDSRLPLIFLSLPSRTCLHLHHSYAYIHRHRLAHLPRPLSAVPLSAVCFLLRRSAHVPSPLSAVCFLLPRPARLPRSSFRRMFPTSTSRLCLSLVVFAWASRFWPYVTLDAGPIPRSYTFKSARGAMLAGMFQRTDSAARNHL